MTHSATLISSLNEAYNLLPDTKKHMAASAHDCSASHFKKILKGKVSDSQEYTKALKSIKRASQTALDNQTANHNTINEIVTKELQKLTVTNPENT